MKCSLGISNFLKRSLIFPILLFSSVSLHCSFKKTFLSPLVFSETLHSVGYIFPFLPCFLLLFFPQPFVKPSQTTTLPSCISFSLGWFWSPPPVQCYKSLPKVLQALCLPDLMHLERISHLHCIIIRDLIKVIPEWPTHIGGSEVKASAWNAGDPGSEWPSGFPYFLQLKPEFCNKELMIWATVSSRSYFCWLYTASPSLAAKNIISLILVLTIWWCLCVELSLGLLEEGVC